MVQWWRGGGGAVVHSDAGEADGDGGVGGVCGDVATGSVW